ncbi:hypothetical protein F4780DRAFT_758569 [Xylariomycetidae sp. FL0641]|nr:hypothetical protein F4780DRAFT_758569 [Xylariomycetidae sp. FL0641]
MIPSLNSQPTQVALLEWANAMRKRLPEGKQTGLDVKKVQDLYSGEYFSLLLEVMDPEYSPTRFQQNLASSTSETGSKRRNMHIIHVSLLDYARRRCDDVEPLIRSIDFQALDRDPTPKGMFEILAALLYASLREPNSPSYIEVTQTLESQHQLAIMQVYQEVDAKMDQGFAAPETDSAGSRKPAHPDDDLAQEAAIAGLQREVEEARQQSANLKNRLDRIQDNYADLSARHEKLQDENDDLHKQIESEAGNYDRHRLQRQIKENEAVIAGLEDERNTLLEEKQHLTKDKARLEVAAQKAESLIDENQELKSKMEELSKKANMADNLRKKVENMKPMEQELTQLRGDKVDVARLYDQLKESAKKIESLRKESEAYVAKMEAYELDIAGLSDLKLILTQQNNELRARTADLEQRSQLDEVVVKDLQEKVMMLDPSAVSDDPLDVRPSSLEDELGESSNNMSMKSLEIQRLQAENAVLKSSIGTETEKGQLIQEMENMRASRQSLQDKYNEMFERYTVGQKQLDALIENMGKDGQEAYANLRTQVLAEQNRSKQLERQLESTKQQLSDKERSLLEARGDLNAVEKSSMDALAELKNTDGMLAVSLRAELDAERKKYRCLKDEAEAQQKQLLAAFIEKDELRREAEQANRELQKAADGQTVSTDSIKQSEKMEKLRTRYKQLQQQLEQSDAKNRELERTLKAVRAGSEAGAQKAQADQVIKNLQRENALIATAWYDLSSRLQSNHVVLQRRNDVPRSWLNKQRHLVNATPRR